MKKRKRISVLSGILALLLLSGCGSGGSKIDYSGISINIDDSPNAVRDWVDYQVSSNELETQNILCSQVAYTSDVLTNLFDGLTTNDTKGNVVPCLAKSWESPNDGKDWIFRLRDDAVWVNGEGKKMADLTSRDFVTGLEWVLNAAKNEGLNTQMPMAVISGAGEYYSYTEGLSREDALSLTEEEFLAMVGIETPDDYTVVYHCIFPCSYFPTLGCHNCLYPAPKALVDSLGPEGFLSENIYNSWYSGPYIMTSYIQGNEKILDPNPLWWGNDEYRRFESVTVKMVDDNSIAFQLYRNGEVNYTTLAQSEVSNILRDPENRYHDFLSSKFRDNLSFCLVLNYNKILKDGTPDTNWNMAVANEAFRLSLYYGLDLKPFYEFIDSVAGLRQEINAFTARTLATLSDGTDYTDLVKSKLGIGEYNGETMARYDREKGAQYREQAVAELTEMGVRFPVVIDYFISASSQSELDKANVLKQCISDSFGDDYVTLNIDTFVKSYSNEVCTPGYHSLVISGWGADYGDPDSFLSTIEYGSPSAYFAESFTKINDVARMTDPEDYRRDLIGQFEEYNRLFRIASSITDDADARFEAMAEAESCLLRHGLLIPFSVQGVTFLSDALESSRIHSVYGIQTMRYLNWVTDDDGIKSGYSVKEGE